MSSVLGKNFNKRVKVIVNQSKTISKDVIYPLQCQSLQKRIRLAMTSDLPVVLIGNPGVGKTELAKKIANTNFTYTTTYEVPKSNVELESSNLFGMEKSSLSSDHDGSKGVLSLIAEPNKGKSLILDEFQNLSLELMDRMQTLFDSRVFRRVLRKEEETYSIQYNKLVVCMNMPLKSLPHSLLRRFKDINKVIFIALEGVDLYSDEQKLGLFEFLWQSSGYELSKITKSMKNIVLQETYPNNFQSMQELVDGFYNNEHEVDGFAIINRHYNNCFDILANIEDSDSDFFQSWRAMRDAENQLDKITTISEPSISKPQTRKEKLVHLNTPRKRKKETLNLYNEESLKNYLSLQISNGFIDHNDLLAMIEKITLIKCELCFKKQSMDQKEKVLLLKFSNIISVSLDNKSAIRQYKRLQQTLLKEVSSKNQELLFEYQVSDVSQLSRFIKNKFIGNTSKTTIPYDFREQIIEFSSLEDEKKQTEIRQLETLLSDQIKKRERVINSFFEANNLNGRFNFFDALQNIGKDTVMEWIDTIHADLIKHNTEKNISKFCKNINISRRRYYDIQELLSHTR